MATSWVEFQKTNTTGTELTLNIPAGGFVWFLTDDSSGSAVTYVRISRASHIDIAPAAPNGWNAFRMYYDVDTTFKIPVSGLTNYTLCNNFFPHVRIN